MADKLAPPALTSPRFGQADLSSCEREQIHLAGSIQPWGALVVLRERDQMIVQASANAAAFLGLQKSLLGKTLADLPGDIAVRARPHLGESLDVVPVAFRGQLGEPRKRFTALMHRSPGGGLVVELESAGSPTRATQGLQAMIQGILDTPSRQALCDEAARLFREVAGYDRVMIYQFDDEGHGQVVSEQREPALEAYLGNRYPASDIPQMARRLYERNRVRVLVDVEYVPVPLEPVLSPVTGMDLDMSLCCLRSVSPIHIQYLKNMGVRATLVASLVVGGHLWGLVSCHHYQPRVVPYATRALCEVLAEAVATRIAALESFARGQAEISVRRLEQSMITAVARKGDWRVALLDSPQSVLEPLDASGAALIFEDEIRTAGEVPGTLQLREIKDWLDCQALPPIFATASLGRDVPQFAHLANVASGLVVASLAQGSGNYLVWFRPERVRTVTWGGDPFKNIILGNDPEQLSPRRSFAQWHQVVQLTSDPWTEADLAAARMIVESVTDVVLQFRAVRTIIAQDQLEQVRNEVASADQPVLICDGGGNLIQANPAFSRLLAGRAAPASLDALPDLFVRRHDIASRLSEMLTRRRGWRGEADLVAAGGPAIPLLIRADPVLGTHDRLLGFVILLTDLTERREAAEARHRFQEDLVVGGQIQAGRLQSQADLAFYNAVSVIVENAQLAALEITDGLDAARIPGMLTSVKASALRASEILKSLLQDEDES